MSEPTEIARITIVKTFDDTVDGGEACAVDYSEGLSLIDALGMLAFATAFTPETYVGVEDDEG